MQAKPPAKERLARRAITLALYLAIAGLFFAVALALWQLLAQSGGQLGWQGFMIAGAGLVALLACWIALSLTDQHFDDLERLRGDLLSAGESGRLPVRAPEHALDGEASRLALAAETTLRRRAGLGTPGEALLADLVSLVGEGLLVVTDSGLVSLVNATALSQLPAGVKPGGSIFAHLLRDDLIAAEDRLKEAGRPIETTLRRLDGGEIRVRLAQFRDHGGLVISLPGDGGWLPEIAHDLSLHDQPPAAPPPGPDTLLSDLPAVVLDCETTGLDVANDRIVSLGALRLHGARVYPHLALDRLVNPGRPIPPASSRIHGITDKMVEQAESFGALLPTLRGFLGSSVLIGHNIGFDLAILVKEAARTGEVFPPPFLLDTGQIVSALESAERDLNLDTIAQRLGVQIEGRHTALGDCLVTAEIWRRLLGRLEAAGIRTLGQAREFQAGAKALIALQRQRGWHQGA